MRRGRPLPIVRSGPPAKGIGPLSDTATLIAGVLLTSVGLLALLPYLLKRGWQTSVLASEAGSVVAPSAQPSTLLEPRTVPSDEPLSVSKGDLEELTAQLFSLRMAVSDANADLEETRVMLDEAADEAEAEDAEAEEGASGEVA